MPTVNDSVTISLHGNLMSTGAYVVSAGASIVGTNILFDVTAADTGGVSLLLPDTEDIVLGTLPVGNYLIIHNDLVGVSCMAPPLAHVFTVSSSMALPSLENDGLLVAMQHGQLSITATDGGALGQLEVLDAQGKVVLSTHAVTSRFEASLATNAPGVYMVRLSERGVLQRVLVE